MAEQSEIDKLLRDRALTAERQREYDERLQAFYESAIDYAVADLAIPVMDGFRRAIGPTTQLYPNGSSTGIRNVKFSAASQESGAEADVYLRIQAKGPITENPRGINFSWSGSCMLKYGGRTKQVVLGSGGSQAPRPIPTAVVVSQTITAAFAQMLDGR